MHLIHLSNIITVTLTLLFFSFSFMFFFLSASWMKMKEFNDKQLISHVYIFFINKKKIHYTQPFKTKSVQIYLSIYISILKYKHMHINFLLDRYYVIYLPLFYTVDYSNPNRVVLRISNHISIPSLKPAMRHIEWKKEKIIRNRKILWVCRHVWLYIRN